MKFVRVLATAVLLAAVSSATGQSSGAYPVKPIHWIVPFASGSSDLLARIVGQKASESLEQQLLIEARPGAGGNIGAAAVARAPTDEYTILLGTIATHGINSSLYNSLPYDALTGLITMVHHICGGIGAYIGAGIFDATSRYDSAFVIMLAVSAVALAITLALRRPRHAI